jgi:thioredoxin reductase (NADPH)
MMTAPTRCEVAIVGGGPAGVSCAIWLKQLGFNPILIEKNATCGGLQLLNAYTNTWIATSANAHGKDVAAALQANIERHEVQTRMSTTAAEATLNHDGITIRTDADEVIKASFLVLAGGVKPKGAGFAARIGLLVGPGPAVASSDFTGQRVAILGGGDSALENYRFIKNRGASLVHVYARSLRARAEMLERASPDDIHVGSYTTDADRNLVNGEHYDVVVVLYGYEAHKSALMGLEPLMRSDGFVFTDQDCMTSIDRVYAIGEIAQRAHPCCVTSMADGVVAAKAIQRRMEASKASQFLGAVKRLGRVAAMAAT